MGMRVLEEYRQSGSNRMKSLKNYTLPKRAALQGSIRDVDHWIDFRVEITLLSHEVNPPPGIYGYPDRFVDLT